MTNPITKAGFKVMHKANRPGGFPLCRNQRAHAATDKWYHVTCMKCLTHAPQIVMIAFETRHRMAERGHGLWEFSYGASAPDRTDGTRIRRYVTITCGMPDCGASAYITTGPDKNASSVSGTALDHACPVVVS